MADEARQRVGLAPPEPDVVSPGNGGREHLLVLLAGAALTVFLLYPISLHPGRHARADRSDGQFSLWNVAWVARTMVVDPVHLFDANIFYPHRGTLLYSETNLVAGALAVPVYWATRNPYIAHNAVMIFAFFLTTVGMYWLAAYVTGNRWGAAVSAICFAFCPFVFAHNTHIQLLMTPGIPFSMLAFHRMADVPSRGRAVGLGLAMAFTTFCCAYYGIFVTLLIGWAVLVTAFTRRLWRDRRYWSAVGVAAAVAAGLVLPLFAPYFLLQRVGAFNRPLAESVQYAADWHSYFASAGLAHQWMLPYVTPWSDLAFPGFVALVLGLGRLGSAWGLRGRSAEVVILYGSLTALAVWASFGPNAGLYSALFHAMPGFALMRAPVRFALIVVFGLSVLTGHAVAALQSRARWTAGVGALLLTLAVADHLMPLDFPPPVSPSPAYRVLARLPRAPVIEMPFFDRPRFYPRHTIYMLMSTLHWMPLVNGYSDYVPPGFEENGAALAPFPYPSAFDAAHRLGVRYAMFHLDVYDEKTRAEVEERLEQFSTRLRPLYADENTRLYEILEGESIDR